MTGTTPVHVEGDTIVAAFRHNVARIPHRPTSQRIVTRWETMTWANNSHAVSEVTAGLAELGVVAGQRVGIFSNNRAEWHLADLGTHANGSVTVPIYQTSSSEQVAQLLGHAANGRVFRRKYRYLAGRILEDETTCPSSNGSSCSTTTIG